MSRKGKTSMGTSGEDANSASSKIDEDIAVEVRHLNKTYGSVEAVRDVTFSVKKGEIFGVIGPNGAGKTTTVECISGLRLPDSGTISVMGMSPVTDRAKIRRILGVQLQESAILPSSLSSRVMGSTSYGWRATSEHHVLFPCWRSCEITSIFCV